MANAETEMDRLCAELGAYCDQQGLPAMSADELVCELQAIRGGGASAYIKTAPTNIDACIQWLSDFILRWDAFMSSET
jgi:hypothetical protein